MSTPSAERAPGPAAGEPTPSRRERAVAFLRRHVAGLFILAVAAGTLLFLRAQGLAYGWNTVAYVVPAQLRRLPMLLAQGIALQAAARLLTPRRIVDYARVVVRPRWIAGWLATWLGAIGILYTYVWLKVSVPLVRADLYDAALWKLDRWLHFGVSPSILAIEAAAGTVLPPLLDRWYSIWMLTIPLAFAYVFASAEGALRRNFLLANAVLWLAGCWIYLLVPAVGPCFATPEIVDPIREQMPVAMASQQGLFANYGRMIGGRGDLLRFFQPEFGVAAMPSLHVGAHGLFALWSRRYAPRLFLFWAVSTGLTFLGSLVSGWHYAVDGYAGMLLAWGAMRVADRFQPAPRAEPSGEEREGERPTAAA